VVFGLGPIKNRRPDDVVSAPHMTRRVGPTRSSTCGRRGRRERGVAGGLPPFRDRVRRRVMGNLSGAVALGAVPAFLVNFARAAGRPLETDLVHAHWLPLGRARDREAVRVQLWGSTSGRARTAPGAPCPADPRRHLPSHAQAEARRLGAGGSR
jgi:hypothetical protein